MHNMDVVGKQFLQVRSFHRRLKVTDLVQWHGNFSQHQISVEVDARQRPRRVDYSSSLDLLVVALGSGIGGRERQCKP
jgi:hypothetical protein